MHESYELQNLPVYYRNDCAYKLLGLKRRPLNSPPCTHLRASLQTAIGANHVYQLHASVASRTSGAAAKCSTRKYLSGTRLTGSGCNHIIQSTTFGAVTDYCKCSKDLGTTMKSQYLEGGVYIHVPIRHLHNSHPSVTPSVKRRYPWY